MHLEAALSYIFFPLIWPMVKKSMCDISNTGRKKRDVYLSHGILNMFVFCTVGNENSEMFLHSVWVVEVHTFLRDCLKDIEQCAHMLSDMSLCSVVGIHGLFMGSSAYRERKPQRLVSVWNLHWWRVWVRRKRIKSGCRFVAKGVKTCKQPLLICIFHSSFACITLRAWCWVFYFLSRPYCPVWVQTVCCVKYRASCHEWRRLWRCPAEVNG